MFKISRKPDFGRAGHIYSYYHTAWLNEGEEAIAFCFWKSKAIHFSFLITFSRKITFACTV